MLLVSCEVRNPLNHGFHFYNSLPHHGFKINRAGDNRLHSLKPEIIINDGSKSLSRILVKAVEQNYIWGLTHIIISSAKYH